jgi:general secretion pathway protein G
MLLTTVRTARQKAARRAGFTLLEVLVVVAILVILAGVASISVFRYLEDAKVGAAKTSMQTLEQAVKKYYTENGEWPPNNNLQAVAPYLDQGTQALVDPWGGQYQLQIISFQDETDGTEKQRPQLMCQPKGNKPPVYWPTK